jgi:HK97 gp10 family phage protein
MPAYRIIEGADTKQLKVKVKRLDGDFRRGIRLGFWETGKDFVKIASEQIKRKKTGTPYKRILGKRKVVIRAGAAGDYPANITGANRRSLDFKVQGGDELEFGAGKKYSPFLERGTSKMAARPFLQPTVKKNINKLRNSLRREIGRAFRGLR